MKSLNQSLRRVMERGVVGASVLLLLAGELFVLAAHAATPPKINIDDTPLPRDNRPAMTFAPVIKKISPSVVNIYTSKTLRIDPSLRQYLRELYGFGVPTERRQQSLGSGIIVSQ